MSVKTTRRRRQPDLGLPKTRLATPVKPANAAKAEATNEATNAAKAEAEATNEAKAKAEATNAAKAEAEATNEAKAKVEATNEAKAKAAAPAAPPPAAIAAPASIVPAPPATDVIAPPATDVIAPPVIAAPVIAHPATDVIAPPEDAAVIAPPPPEDVIAPPPPEDIIAPPPPEDVIAPPASEDPPPPPAEDAAVIAPPAEDAAVIAPPAEDPPAPATDVIAPATDVIAPASEDHPAPAPASVPVIDAVPAAPNATNINCMNEPTLFSSTDPACHVPAKTPELYNLIEQVAEAVVHKPIDYIVENGTDAVVVALEATGNKAIVDLAIAETLTPEQAELLNKLSDDPEVAAALKEVEAKALDGINQSIEKATEVVLPKLQEATADLTKGVLAAAVTAASDVPPVGAVISAVTAAGTVIDAAKNAIQIVPEINDALQPMKDAVAEISKVTDAVDGAVARAQNASSHDETENENEHAHGAPGQEFEMQPMGASAATASAATASAATANESANESVNASESVKPPRFVEATPHKPDPNQPFARKQTKTEEEQDNAGLGGGGSRKRRRIHKLSRRIERTLRRVQKKYGLKDKGDKGDFLRRTLKNLNPKT